MDDEEHQKVFTELLEYYREMVEEEYDLDELSDDEYESCKLEFYEKYPLLKKWEVDVYDNWKGLYIEIGNFTPALRGKYTAWMLPTVFSKRGEDLTQQRHEFEQFYFGRILKPDSSEKCFDVKCY